MKGSIKPLCAGLASVALFLLQACSDNDAKAGSKVTNQATEAEEKGFEPGESLAFEWSANGFEQLPSQYVWTGSGKRDDVFQPNFSLSVPETDDAIWSSECAGGGKVRTTIYFAPPKKMQRNRSTLRFETDTSAKTLQYPVSYVSNGQFDGFQFVQAANDSMFADMRAGKWAYVHIGEGADGTKLRISLANAAKGLVAFLPACTGTTKQAAAAASSMVRYACDDGRTARATYLGNDTDTPVVRLEIGDAIYLLPQVVSGSGARYEAKQQIWHTKGRMGVFTDVPDGDGQLAATTSCQAA